jgi:biotin-(acetyl-CoA carboxylase) ligase
LVTEDGRKLGGVLVEGNSEDDGIRVGIGLNKRSGVIDGTTVAGWDEFVGEKTAIEVFDILDPAISSHFEEHSLVPLVEEDELVALSWKSLARSLSTGVVLRYKGSRVRAVGLSSEGHLLTEFDGLVATIDDINTLDWSPIT